MKKIHLLFVTALLLSVNAVAQGISFNDVVIDTITGKKQIINCSGQSYTIRPTIMAGGGSVAGYTVQSIPFAPPFPIGPVPGYTTQLFTDAADDTWSSIIPLPFGFCFFRNTYNQAVVGANGILSFDVIHTPDNSCPWDLKSSPDIPSPNFIPEGLSVFNSIFGVYEDTYPVLSYLTPGVNGIYQGIFGVFPFRTLCVSFKDIPLFANQDQRNSYQIVLYEGSNIIEVYVEHRELPASGWNNGIGIIGIINNDGTDGIAAPGRNTTSSTWSVMNTGQQ
ncbi:MAG: hypothetical protein LBV75_06330, partial [Paludibacter sp.]|nr:hypothetical protein [Paludibacter sp.]